MSTDVDLRELAVDRSGTDAPRAGRRHVFTRYVLPLVLLLGFIALMAWSARNIVFPPRDVTVVPVISSTAEVSRAGQPLFQAAGWVEPRPTPIRVAALAPGVVEELLVVEDQAVSKGEPVAELVKDDAQLAYQRALADLELRQAEVAEAEAALTAATTRLEQPVHLEAALGEAEAALAKLNTELRNLPFHLKRAQADAAAMESSYAAKKSSAGVVSGVEIDIAKAKADAAGALVQELNDRLESLTDQRTALTQRRDALKTQLELLADETKAQGESSARVRAAAAKVKQAEVMVAEAKLRLDRMTVRAPVDGRVYRLVANPGTSLSSGSGPMASSDNSTVVTMYRPEALQIRVDVRFEDIPKVSLDQPVEINNPALAEPITGEVLYISSEADIQKNTLEVKVAITDPPRVFKPEMLVDVTFLAPEVPEGTEASEQQVRLFIPRQLVQQSESGSFVWVADQSDGIARRVAIETSPARTGAMVEVTRGLTVSSRLIASGIEGLSDGDRIRITQEQAPTGQQPTRSNDGTD